MTEDLNTLREALEPCPFCGGINIIHCAHHMYCHACGADGPDADTNDQDAAEEAWNRRAPRLEALPPRIMALLRRVAAEGWQDEHGESLADDAQVALSRLEAAADHIVDANKMVPKLSREDVVRLAGEAGIKFQINEGITGRINMTTRGSQNIERIERFASLVRSVPVGREVRGWMCATNWHHELGEASDGTEIYGDLDDLKKHRPCWEQCGVVEVVVRLADENQRGGDRAQYHADLIASVKEMRAARPAVPAGEVKPVAWATMFLGEPSQFFKAHEVEKARSEFDRLNREYPRDKAKRSLAALYTTQPAPPEGWRPIETAPKDGTSVLVFHESRLWPGVAYIDARGNWYWSTSGAWAGHPSHWMPLSAPPLAAAPQPGDKT